MRNIEIQEMWTISGMIQEEVSEMESWFTVWMQTRFHSASVHSPDWSYVVSSESKWLPTLFSSSNVAQTQLLQQLPNLVMYSNPILPVIGPHSIFVFSQSLLQWPSSLPYVCSITILTWNPVDNLFLLQFRSSVYVTETFNGIYNVMLCQTQ